MTPWRLPDLRSAQQEFLKIVAVVTMILDHINRVFFGGDVPGLVVVGRTAFPLFAFLVAYNVERRGVSPRRYFVPLVAAGMISQFFYVKAFGVDQLNILFTLLAATLSLQVYAVLRRRGLDRWGAAAFAAIPVTTFGLFCEYGSVGALLPCLFYLWLRRPNLPSAALLLTGVLAANGFAFISLFGLLAVALILVVTALPLVLPRLPRWFFYSVYPGHIALLWLLK